MATVTRPGEPHDPRGIGPGPRPCERVIHDQIGFDQFSAALTTRSPTETV